MKWSLKLLCLSLTACATLQDHIKQNISMGDNEADVYARLGAPTLIDQNKAIYVSDDHICSVTFADQKVSDSSCKDNPEARRNFWRRFWAGFAAGYKPTRTISCNRLGENYQCREY